MLSPETIWQTVGIVASCITTFVAILYSRERMKRGRRDPDRIEFWLERNERLVHQQQQENERKGELIDELQKVNTKLREDLNRSDGMIELLKDDLKESRRQISNQQLQIDRMKSRISNNQETI